MAPFAPLGSGFSAHAERGTSLMQLEEMPASDEAGYSKPYKYYDIHS